MDSTPFLEAMGQRIRSLRKGMGLSLKALGERCDLTQSFLWQIEKGQSMPGAGTLWRLSQQFGVSIDYLVKGE